MEDMQATIEQKDKSNKFFKWDINKEVTMPAFSTKNGRLVFNNSFDFLQAVRFAQKQSDATMLSFQEKANYKSLYTHKLSTDTPEFNLSDLPAGYLNILNTKGEVQVGDTLVCYAADGFKYFIPNGDEKQLQYIKTNPSAIALKWEYRPKQIIRPTSADEKGLKQTQVTYFAPNTIDARYQKEYRVNGDGNSKRKFVYELAFYQDYWFAYSSYVSQTKLKLEWWSNGSSSWQPAGETRFKQINNLRASTSVFNDGVAFDWGGYEALLIQSNNGSDLTQALFQGWAWGGLDYAYIGLGETPGNSNQTEYKSFVMDPSHTNFGGVYNIEAYW